MTAECDDIVSKIPLFSDCRPHTLKRLLSNLQKKIFLPGEIVVLYGDRANEMFLIRRGVFDVLSKDGDLIRVHS